MKKVNKLIGKNLDGFTVQMHTEVYKADVRGKGEIVGYFKNEAVAKAFIENQIDSAWHQAQDVLLLTNGKTAFLIGNEAKLMDDEKAKLKAFKSIRAKLSPAERELLGL